MAEYLHSYWRVEYVSKPKDKFNSKENPFVELPKIKDERESLLIFRGKHTYITMNKYPYNAGHLLVIPYRQVSDLLDMSQEERTDFFENIVKAEKILKDALTPDAFNIGLNMGLGSGAGIPQHIHCHVIPRWISDTNFMPIIADTKVLHCAMETMWERLKSFV